MAKSLLHFWLVQVIVSFGQYFDVGMVPHNRVKHMSLNVSALTQLGWSDFFEMQLTDQERDETYPCRVMAVHRGELHISNGEQDSVIMLTPGMIKDMGDTQITVGDWLLASRMDGQFLRLLERKSEIKRQAAVANGSEQMVAANIDALFIVTSCNDDFNLSRLERYLAFAYASDVEPVIVITKQDMSDDPQDYVRQARSLGPAIIAELVNAKDPETTACLQHWCKLGQTVALVGSSGVGKSTLANALGAADQKTGAIREDDAKGRHTTTHRSLLPLAGGAVLLDSPGIRGLALVDSGAGVAEAFEDIAELAAQCRFNNCSHDSEPGCAVKAALEQGSLSQRRLRNYSKLMAEQAHSAATIAERRKKDKDMGKFHKKVKGAKKARQK